MKNMTRSEIAAELREIRRSITRTPGERIMTRYATIKWLQNLERDVASTTDDAYQGTEIVGYDTVLGYLSKYDPVVMDLTLDPVFDTVADGKALAQKCRARGATILRVAACKHIKQRYPKVTHVNAYPINLLAEHYGNA